jgi:hypothetical protein
MFPFVIQISEILMERERKLRQAMSTMGLHDLSYWLSWHLFLTPVAMTFGFFIYVFGCIFQFRIFLKNGAVRPPPSAILCAASPSSCPIPAMDAAGLQPCGTRLLARAEQEGQGQARAEPPHTHPLAADFGVVFLTFWLFSQSMVGVGFFLASLLSRSAQAVLVGFGHPPLRAFPGPGPALVTADLPLCPHRCRRVYEWAMRGHGHSDGLGPEARLPIAYR